MGKIAAVQPLPKESESRTEAPIKGAPVLWFDTGKLRRRDPSDDLFARVSHSSYTGIVVAPEDVQTFLPVIPERMSVILRADAGADLSFLSAIPPDKRIVVGLTDPERLLALKRDGYKTCFFCQVDDQDSLTRSIEEGGKFDHVSICFRDSTNIPLELVVATLQNSDAIVIKEIKANDVDDAVVALGVMEAGADGVIFSPTSHDAFDKFQLQIERLKNPPVPMSVGTVVESRPVGMGFRACIDTATMFEKDEGILVGSTSQGGLLCCPEVFPMPYMDLRPFRVNAGAVHSYVYGAQNRTAYISELKAGSSVMVVSTKGVAQTVPVGRAKIEKRPLRMICVQFPDDKKVNVLLQDDWHLRIFSDAGTPRNIDGLKLGDKLLGHVTNMGRHVGIKIDEAIIER